MADEPQSNDQARFEIQKVYLKDASLECPNSPELFRNMEWTPEANLQLNTGNAHLDESHFEVHLTVTLTVKSGEKTAYLVELQQAGVFTIQNIPNDKLGPMLGIACPNILFPFAREAAADLIQKAGFPQHLLPPVNFEALYAQHVRQQQGTANSDGTRH